MAELIDKVNFNRKNNAGIIPDKIKSANIQDLIQSIVLLLRKIDIEGNKDEGLVALERITKTLVRGLGSSNVQVQKNYFVALVTLQKYFEALPEFSVNHIIRTMDSELHITGNLPKGEEGEILMGKILAFGALVRSGSLVKAEDHDQTTALSQLLKNVKGKSYLPLAADPFLIEYLKQVDESVFKRALWECVREEVAPGPTQSLLIYHVLLVCEERFPSTVSHKFLKQTLNSPTVLSPAIVPALLSALKNDFRLKALNHSAYTDIFKYLANAPEEVVLTFWQRVETDLLDSTSVSNKQVMAIRFFSLIVSQLQNASQVINLLTPKLISWFMRKHKMTGYFQKLLNKGCKEALNNLYKLCARDESSKSLLSVIKKLLFDPGNILFEQCSGTKVVHQLMILLKEKAVVKLAVMLRAVITGSSTAVELKDAETTTRPWHNKERLHTVHLFCKLISLPAVQSNTSWRLQQLIFLCDTGFFPTANIGVELASHVRESFFSCLNHKLPNLVDLRNILAGIVEHINQRLDKGDELRIKTTSEVLPAWKKMYTTAKQIGEEKKRKKEQWVTAVFQTMFYHIGLHLFKEAAFATDVLQELHSVYDRVGSSVSVSEEPHWTEVVVEMFLSLLSRNSQLHRHLIGCVFSHFCPIMIPQNIHQILQVLDPTSDTNPLLNSLDPDSESSSEESEAEGEADEDEEGESSDDGMSEEGEAEDEKVSDKLRRAVFEALGDNGALTDVESVDLDDMDEEEAARVDKALSEAFKAHKQVKSKKQSSHAKALTHFRLRVLDLVEVWLSSEPALDLLVDTLLRLVALLEHSLVDRHQAPLETRLRSVIKKLTATKKYDVSDCKSLKLGAILKDLLDKGNRTTTVYMSIIKELTSCTLFMVRAAENLNEDKGEESADNPTVHLVLKEIVKSFFLQRDCLLTVGLFERLFQQNSPQVCALAAKLPAYVFDQSVHPFRRSKALEFLMIFWKNNRLLMESNDEYLDLLRKMSKRLYKGSVKMMEEPPGRVQLKFMLLLKKTFEIIRSKSWLTDIDWQQHILSLTDFQKKYVKSESIKDKKVNGHQDVKMEVEEDAENEQSQNESEDEILAEGKINEKISADEDEELSPSENGEEKRNLADDDDNNEKDEEEEEESDQESNNSLSSSEKPSEKQLSKKSEKKRSHEKMKRTQLLKNNSKRLRLESMALGLEENVFSKYSLLTNNTALHSPDR